MVTLLMLVSVSVASILATRVIFTDYPKSAIAIARHNLFSLRDELFGLAKAGALDFESPGYKACRQMLNGMIRYAHELSAFHIVTIMLIAKLRGASPPPNRLEEAMAALPAEARQHVDRVQREAMVHMFRLLITRSVVLSYGFAALLGVQGTCRLIGHLFHKISRLDVKQSGEATEQLYTEVLRHRPGRRFGVVVRLEALRRSQAVPDQGLRFAA